MKKFFFNFKSQLDLWSIVHTVGPLIILLGLIWIGVDRLQSKSIAILSVFMWEMFDHIFRTVALMSHTINKFWYKIFDCRGVSYLDYLLGVFPILIVSHIIKIDMTVLDLVMIFYTWSLISIFYLNFSYWKDAYDKQ